ncbi:hypothetical protein [Haliscomenobacter sp.]|uniref:hypothetical protein n=1 Tax=Haliscomenobacter sp. TaxID=2717303 RepID=UPI003364F15D
MPLIGRYCIRFGKLVYWVFWHLDWSGFGIVIQHNSGTIYCCISLVEWYWQPRLPSGVNGNTLPVSTTT